MTTSIAPFNPFDDVAAMAPRVRPTLREGLIRGEDILTLPPPRSLVGELLALDSLAAIYGPPGACKTFLALDIALSVAARRPWQGRIVVDGPVLYVAAESASGIAQRARAWHARHGDLGAISWLTRPVALLDPHALGELLDIIIETVPALVIVDTLARCLVGADENSARDMGAAVDALDQLRAVAGACILAVHHGGKDRSRGMRGSSAILGAVDTAIECQRTQSGVLAIVTKQKNATDGQRLHFNLDPEGDSAVLVEGPPSAEGADAFRPTHLMEKASRYLEEATAPASLRSILMTVTGKRDYVIQAVERLRSEGYVDVEPGARGATYHRSVKPYREDDDAGAS